MPIAFFRNLQNLDPREIEKWPYLGCATKTHEESPQYECRCKWRVRFCGLEPKLICNRYEKSILSAACRSGIRDAAQSILVCQQRSSPPEQD
jgi:hypothetical protein